MSDRGSAPPVQSTRNRALHRPSGLTVSRVGRATPRHFALAQLEQVDLGRASSTAHRRRTSFHKGTLMPAVAHESRRFQVLSCHHLTGLFEQTPEDLQVGPYRLTQTGGMVSFEPDAGPKADARARCASTQRTATSTRDRTASESEGRKYQPPLCGLVLLRRSQPCRRSKSRPLILS